MPAPQQPDDERDDIDPTGIRELLASLPDPGPMPDDLVRRIEARLEVERAHQRTGGDGPEEASTGGVLTGSAVTRADNVFDLAAERGHRRPARTVAILGAAAAGLLVTTVAVTQFMGLSGGGPTSGDTAASYPSLSRSDGGGAADGGGADAPADEALADAEEELAAAEDTGEDAAAGDDAAALEDVTGLSDSSGGEGEASDTRSIESDPELGGGRLGVLPDLGSVTVQDLVATLSTALTDDDLRFGPDDLTLEQARSCWSVLAGEHEFDGHLAARAQFVSDSGEGQPAVALLGIHDDGTGQAWVVPSTCTTDPRVAPLSGPHPFG